jgi:hypothetical protein
VQTFVPYPDLRASCVVLDDRRLGKQRVETFQILRALTWPSYAWKNHPAVRMWRGFVPGLVEYGLESCREWTRRGYADSVADQLLDWTAGEQPVQAPLPPWWGWEALHLSHRSALLRKDPAHYRPIFGDEPDDLPYLWPPAVFPRWPVRAGGAPLPVDQAVRLLGFDEPRPGQAEAATAAAAGRDVLLVARPGTGGSAAGLLAGLATPGRTLWVSPPWGPPAGPVPPVDLPAPRELPAAGERPPALARPPGEQDRAAMRAESAPPDFVFATRAELPALADLGLVVVDRADEVTDRQVAAVVAARAPAPVLLVVGRADAGRRAALTARFALRDPVWAGGGWDPGGTRLEALAVGTAAQRRRALSALVRDGGPALVVAGSRERADRLATTLLADGLRAAVWAPAPMRATRAAQSVAAWRSRRLDALVVPAGEPPRLGRGRLGLLVDAAGSTPEQWRDRLAALQPERSVLLVGPDEPGTALLAQPGCLRAALLEPFGEPVPTPCGRCARCGPAPASPAAAGGR